MVDGTCHTPGDARKAVEEDARRTLSTKTKSLFQSLQDDMDGVKDLRRDDLVFGQGTIEHAQKKNVLAVLFFQVRGARFDPSVGAVEVDDDIKRLVGTVSIADRHLLRNPVVGIDPDAMVAHLEGMTYGSLKALGTSLMNRRGGGRAPHANR